jgi:hypothetical protein
MRKPRNLLPAARAFALALIASAMVASCPATAQELAGKQVELRYQSNQEALAAFTPAKALTGGKYFAVRGDTGALDVAGSPVKFAVRWHQGLQVFFAGLDANGNGTLNENEWCRMNLSGTATFQDVKVGDKKHIIRIADMRASLKQPPSVGVEYFSCGYVVCGFHEGLYEGTPIRVFDDNLDGAITQDGNDAIMVGRGGAAIPLMKFHQIGNRHCSLEVAKDGSTVTVTPVSSPALGIVETSFKRGLKVLAMVDTQGNSYDLVASGRTGIPAGSYKLVYGVLSDGSAFTVIKPTAKCPIYEVQAGKINTLRIGAPLWVSFYASFSKGNVSVSPAVNIYGAGNEEYTFDFSGGKGRPNVLMMEGQTLLGSPIPMGYG